MATTEERLASLESQMATVISNYAKASTINALFTTMNTVVTNLSDTIDNVEDSIVIISRALAALSANVNATQTYTHIQTPASTTWTVTHSLGSRVVSVVAYNSSYVVLTPTTITLVDDDSLILEFGSSVTGEALIVKVV